MNRNLQKLKLSKYLWLNDLKTEIYNFFKLYIGFNLLNLLFVLLYDEITVRIFPPFNLLRNLILTHASKQACRNICKRNLKISSRFSNSSSNKIVLPFK